jgi:hypothetical protein
MKPTFFLRLAAILVLIFCVMHTLGGVVARPAPGIQAAAVESMQSHSFDVMGHQRTFWDFHVGYGISITVVLFVHAILFWQLSILAKTDAYKIRPLFIPLFLEFLAFVPIDYRYFFFGPSLSSALIAALLAAAFFTARPAASA